MVGKLGRSVAVGVLLIVLVLSLGAANLTIGVERTVLHDEYVIESLDEEGAYSIAVDEAQQQLEAEAEGTQAVPGDLAVDEIFPKVLTENYVRSQVRYNVERGYAYLHGERDDIYLAIDTKPLQENLVDEATTQLLDEDGIAEYNATFAKMVESQEGYQAARQSFKSDQKDRIQEETSFELSEDALETRYQNRRDELRTELKDRLETRVANADHPEELKPLILDMGKLQIDAYTSDMTYAEFTNEYEQIKDSHRDTVRTFVSDKLDEELPETVELSEQLGQEERNQLAQVQSVVGILDLLVYVLPVIGVVTALLIGLVTVLRSSGFLAVGSGTLVIGLVSALGFMGAGSRAETEIATIASQSDIPSAMTELVTALVSKTVSVFVTQSWLIVALGVLLIAVGILIRQGLLPIRDHPGQPTSGSEDELAETGAEEPATDSEGSDSSETEAEELVTASEPDPSDGTESDQFETESEQSESMSTDEEPVETAGETDESPAKDEEPSDSDSELGVSEPSEAEGDEAERLFDDMNDSTEETDTEETS